MTAKPSPWRTKLLLLGATGLLLASCGWGSPPGTYPDPNGPRNGEGLLVDPVTGISLPGQADPGI